MSRDTEVSRRLVRIESKLSRFMVAMGFDVEGNPITNTLVLDETLTDRLISVLEKCLNNLAEGDNDEFEHWLDNLQAEGFELVDMLRSMREGRWRS